MLKLLLILVFVTTGCLAPLAIQETGRTLGEGYSEIVGGIGSPGHVLKFNYGVTENLDLGIQWESINLGLRAKYAFLNNPVAGWSVAGALAAGSVSLGNYYMADVIGSHLSGDWEPYAALRISRTICRETFEEKEKKSSDLLNIISCDKKFYDRGQLTIGSKYWLSGQWFLALELGTLFSASEEPLTVGSTSVGYKF